jgi:hypothetical protein
MPHFNEVRRYVRYGTDPGRTVVTHAARSPVTVSDGALGPDVAGHFVTLEHGSEVVAQVSLFSRMLYVVVLAVAPFEVAHFKRSAHFFDLERRRVVRLSARVAPARQP